MKDLVTVNKPSPDRETGSKIIAGAAFLLIAVPQTDVLPIVPLGLSPARFILFAGAALWILTRLAGQRAPGYRSGALGPVLACYGLAVLAAYGAAMTRTITAPNLDQVMIREILMIVVVLFCFTVIHSVTGLTRVIKGLIVGSVVSAVMAIMARFTGIESAPRLRIPGLINQAPLYFTTDDLFREGMVRAQGSASHPLELACVLAIVFPLALGLTLSLRASGQRWWPWAVATVLIVSGAVVSLSRSGTIGMVVALAVMACYWPFRRTLAIMATVGGLVGLGLLLKVPLISGYLAIFGADRSMEQRAAVTSALPFDISMFGTYGLGLGRQVLGPAAEVPTLDNQYLTALAEMGVFGLVAYLMLVGATLMLAFGAYRNVRARQSADLPTQLFLGLAAAYTVFAVVSIFLDAAGFVQVWTLMWLLIAVTAVAFRVSRRPDGEATPGYEVSAGTAGEPTAARSGSAGRWAMPKPLRTKGNRSNT